MFDFTESNSGPWEEKPTLAEIQSLIANIKNGLISQFSLLVRHENELYTPCRIAALTCEQHNEMLKKYCDARKCLEFVIAGAKTLTPHEFHYLFDELSRDWMP